ncbi:MAG: serine protease [Solirubrobacterales bacterium]
MKTSFEERAEPSPARPKAPDSRPIRPVHWLSALLISLLAFSALAGTAQAAPSQGTGSDETRQAQGRIVNGTVAPEGSWPSIAQLFPANRQCGGTLIDPYTVLTAAHCIVNTEAKASDTTVVLGTNYLDGAPQRKVWGLFPHPDYDIETTANDIAIVVLDQPASQPAMPIARPGDEALLTPGTPAFIAGWGKLCEAESCSAPTDLRQATVPIRETAPCAAAYEAVGEPFTASMFCAGGGVGTSDACQGDSGGPIAVDGPAGRTLVGVVSWGRGCANPDFPGVYTNVAYFSSWIGALTLDKVGAPRSLRVRGRSSITIQNRSSLQLPGTVRTEVKGRFRVIRNTCRNVPYLGTCRVVVRKRSWWFARGTLKLTSASSLPLGRVNLRG